jgi:hypothetical protein
VGGAGAGAPTERRVPLCRDRGRGRGRGGGGGDTGEDIAKILKLIQMRKFDPVIVFSFSRRCGARLGRAVRHARPWPTASPQDMHASRLFIVTLCDRALWS